MKTVLQGMTAEVSARDYLQAKAFLTKMGQQAISRAGHDSTTLKPR